MLTFGFFPPLAQRGLSLDQLLSEVIAETQQAERYGFDAVLLGEHHQQKADCFTSPFLTAMAIAMHTKRIRIGTGILLAPLYHPVHVAEDAAMLDITSQGRLILGLGAGYQQEDFTAFGIPLSHRVSLLEESIAVIRRCWTEERFSFQGKRFTLENVSINPKPRQKPQPPIWLGGWADAAIKRAANLGDAWLIDPIQSPAAVKEMVGLYRHQCAERGVQPHVALIREGWIAETREQALEEYGPRILAIYRYYWRFGAFNERYDPWLKEVKSADELTIEKFGADRFILGSPEDCLRQVEWWQREVGIDHLAIAFRQHNGPSHERVMGALQLFGEKVIPRFT